MLSLQIIALSSVPTVYNGGAEHTCYIATAFAWLFTHPWFFRLWVVQEVGVSKSAIALLGDGEIEFAE
jgi:hypothetical protein